MDDDLTFALSVYIARLKFERDRLKMRASRAESVLHDVLVDLDTLEDRVERDTAERVAAHRAWVVENYFDEDDRSYFRQPSENPLTD